MNQQEKTTLYPYNTGYEDGVEYAKDENSNIQRIDYYCRLNRKQAQEYNDGWYVGYSSIVKEEVKGWTNTRKQAYS